mgnify:CR=1 FL=1
MRSAHEYELTVIHRRGVPRLRGFVETRWRSAVSRVGDQIRSASIHLTDVNGPRGGMCKRCRIVLHSTSVGPIVVQETQCTFPRAITRAITRIAHSLKRELAKKRRRKRRVAMANSNRVQIELEDLEGPRKENGLKIRQHP